MLRSLTNQLLSVLLKTRQAKVGSCYKTVATKHKFLILSEIPNELSKFLKIELKPELQASLLVLGVQHNEFLWNQWVRVMFSDDKGSILFGWLPYHEFCNIIDPWQDQRDLSES